MFFKSVHTTQTQKAWSIPTGAEQYKTHLKKYVGNEMYFHATGSAFVAEDKALPFERALAPYSYGAPFEGLSPAVHHKTHLNVRPENVRLVAECLRDWQLNHKYLSGGDFTRGKVFTLYFSSFTRAAQISARLSSELDGLLEAPCDPTEIDYAPNVSGRFTSNIFDSYPTLGVRGLPNVGKEMFKLDRPRLDLLDDAEKKVFKQIEQTRFRLGTGKLRSEDVFANPDYQNLFERAFKITWHVLLLACPDEFL
jgi:hypothetical protein